jgi:hypothetical protein
MNKGIGLVKISRYGKPCFYFALPTLAENKDLIPVRTWPMTKTGSFLTQREYLGADI